MPKAKKKSHHCQTHEDCRQGVCILCLGKGDVRGIGKSMQDFILAQGICSDFLLEQSYLPSGSCSSCRVHVSKFWKTATPVNINQCNDYLSIIKELRDLPIETRNPKSKLQCNCQICQIARGNFTKLINAQNSDVDSSILDGETPPKNVQNVSH